MYLFSWRKNWWHAKEWISGETKISREGILLLLKSVHWKCCMYSWTKWLCDKSPSVVMRNWAGKWPVRLLCTVFRGNPNFVGSCLTPLAAFEPIYSSLGAWTGPSGLEIGLCYTPRVRDFTNVSICKRKTKQQQNDAGINITEKLPFYFDTAIAGVWWHMEVLPRPQPRGLQQTNLLPQRTFWSEHKSRLRKRKTYAHLAGRELRPR